MLFVCVERLHRDVSGMHDSILLSRHAEGCCKDLHGNPQTEPLSLEATGMPQGSLSHPCIILVHRRNPPGNVDGMHKDGWQGSGAQQMQQGLPLGKGQVPWHGHRIPWH